MSQRSLALRVFQLSALWVLTACAHSEMIHDGDKFTYHDAAFNDRNRAPSSLAPAEAAIDGSSMNALFLRSQADYYYSLGEAYSFEGQNQKAIDSFKATLNYDKDSQDVMVRLASEYLKTGQLTEALEMARKVEAFSPNRVDLKMLLGGIYSSMRSYPKAIESYEAALKLKPDQSDVPLYLGALYTEMKQYDRAIHFFESLAKNPEYNSPHLIQYYIGRVRSEQKEEKNQKLAEAAFKKALAIKPDFTEGVLSLGSLYLRSDQDEKALKVYSEFQKKYGPNPRIADILSQLYIEREMYDEAYEQFEIIEAQSDNSLNIKLKMALILIEKKIYDKAISKLNDVLKEVPDSDKVRFYLGAVYEETKQDDKAIAQFEKIPVVSQYFPEAAVHAAYLLKGMGKLDAAISFMEKAVNQKKNNAQMVAMYASLLDEKGDTQKASVVLNQAVKDFPDNPQVRFYHGTLQDRLGLKDQVIESMKAVIELDPNHVQALNYLAFTWAEANTQLEEAEKMARRAVTLEPKDGYVLDTLGWILFKKGDVTGAIPYLETAHRYQPAVGIIAEHLGDAYYKQALVEKAAKMYTKALQYETDLKKRQEIESKLSLINEQKVIDARSPASFYPER